MNPPKKITILGCGWLGTPLAQLLLQSGYSVAGSTTTVQKIETLTSLGIDAYLIRIDQLSDQVLDFLDADVLVVNIPWKHVSDFERLIREIEKSRIQKVIYISSTSVYTEENQIVTEETPTNDSPLARIEKLFLNNKHFQTTILRFGGLLGYTRQAGRFFKPTQKVKNGHAPVNMIHRDDCMAIISLVISKDCWGETFNCCTDHHPTKREFYTKAAQDIGLLPPVFEDSDTTAYKIVGNEKVKAVLNYTFKHRDLLNLPIDETTQ